MLLVINGVQYKRKLKDWNCTKRRKILLTRLLDGGHTSFPLLYSLSSLPCFLFPLAWLKLFWIFFLFSADENILRQFQLVLATNSFAYRTNLLALDISPNDPIGSRQNCRPSWKIEYKYQKHNHFSLYAAYCQLPYFPEAKLSSTFLPSKIWKYLRTFHQQPKKNSKTFHKRLEVIQKFFRLQNFLSRKSSIFRKYSKTFRPTATGKSNQQQPSTAATCKSKQSTAVINSSNQQMQSTVAINSINRHQQQPSTAATCKSNQQ